MRAPAEDGEQRMLARMQRILRREEILPKIAELAHIPETNRSAFCSHMHSTIWGAWKLHEQRQEGKEIPSKEASKRAAQAMRAVVDALDDLDAEERARITQAFKRMRSQREKSLNSLRNMVSDHSKNTAELMAEREEQELKAYDVLVSQRQWGWFDIIRSASVAFDEASGESKLGNSRDGRRQGRRGRPRGAMTNPGFHRVVRGLLAAAASGGGKLSLDRKNRVEPSLTRLNS